MHLWGLLTGVLSPAQIMLNKTSAPVDTWNSLLSITRLSHLQQPVSCLEAAILDGSPPRQNVLHVDGCRAADWNIPRCDTEAEPLGTCGMKGEDVLWWNLVLSRGTGSSITSATLELKLLWITSYSAGVVSPGGDVDSGSNSGKCLRHLDVRVHVVCVWSGVNV